MFNQYLYNFVHTSGFGDGYKSYIEVRNNTGAVDVRYACLLYDWRESCLLIGPICLHKSLCLPENWSKLAQKVI